MPIQVTPYRPLPFTLDGSEPPCRLEGFDVDLSTRLAGELTEAFADEGLPLPDPICEGLGERTYQAVPFGAAVRVGLGGVRDYGAKWVAEAILAALSKRPVPEMPEPRKPTQEDVRRRLDSMIRAADAITSMLGGGAGFYLADSNPFVTVPDPDPEGGEG